MLYHAKFRTAPEGDSATDAQWQYTPWGRILIGVILAQGLVHGLQLLFMAGLQVSGDEASQELRASPVHLILVQALHGFSLVLGGILTGAGRRRGVFFGSVVGLIHGLIYLGVQQYHGDLLPEIFLYTVPILHMAFGAAGGLIGSLIWKPLPTVSLSKPAADKKPRIPFAVPSGISFLEGPVAWLRVLVGIGLVVAGVMWASVILKFVLDNSPTRLTISSQLQYELITWEIAALTTFLGSAIAGATRANGLKQGLCVGLGAAVLLAGFHLAKSTPDVDRALFVAACAVFLSAGGGWFGGQLFPPICSRPRRKTADLLAG
jgi:hypothetical protein